MDGSGNVYAADTNNHRIQKLKPVTLTSTPRPSWSPRVVRSRQQPVGRDAGVRELRVPHAELPGVYEETIEYLSSDTGLDLDDNGVGGRRGRGPHAGQSAVRADHVGVRAGERVAGGGRTVYLVDHGGSGTFRFERDRETLSSAVGRVAQHAADGDPRQAHCGVRRLRVRFLPVHARGAAGIRGQSGSCFLSTSPGESAYFVTRGTVSFSNYFWTQIFNGVSVGDAFGIANQALSQTFGYQHPLLDDTGDGVGNTGPTARWPVERFIGNGTRQYWEGPVIGAVVGDQTITGTSTATVWADPRDGHRRNRAGVGNHPSAGLRPGLLGQPHRGPAADRSLPDDRRPFRGDLPSTSRRRVRTTFSSTH